MWSSFFVFLLPYKHQFRREIESEWWHRNLFRCRVTLKSQWRVYRLIAFLSVQTQDRRARGAR